MPSENGFHQRPNSGVVKWYDKEKGYGFIIPSTDGAEMFVHRTDVEKSGFERLLEGEEVQYDISTSQGSPKAINILIVGGGRFNVGRILTGTVKAVDASGQCAYIILDVDEGLGDIYAHVSAVPGGIVGRLLHGSKVRFEMHEHKRMPCAGNVTLL